MDRLVLDDESDLAHHTRPIPKTGFTLPALHRGTRPFIYMIYFYIY
jgi:hypothetical protein